MIIILSSFGLNHSIICLSAAELKIKKYSLASFYVPDPRSAMLEIRSVLFYKYPVRAQIGTIFSDL